MPTSLATCRSESATSEESSQRWRAASRMARRVRSLRSPRVSVTGPCSWAHPSLCTCVHAHASGLLTVTHPLRESFSVQTYSQILSWKEAPDGSHDHHPPLQGCRCADLTAGRRPLPRAGQPDV